MICFAHRLEIPCAQPLRKKPRPTKRRAVAHVCRDCFQTHFASSVGLATLSHARQGCQGLLLRCSGLAARWQGAGQTCMNANLLCSSTPEACACIGKGFWQEGAQVAAIAAKMRP